jgi:Rad3-related DNA helicase
MGIKNFPKGYHPSSSQQYAIPNIVDSMNDHKFVIIQGPTGCGKSFIAKTIANGLSRPPSRLTKLINNYTAYETSWENGKLVYEYSDDFAGKRYGTSILTTTKALQDQYTRDFKDIKTLKGKGSYVCNLDDRSSADQAPCIFSSKLKKECWDCNRCDYYEARNKSASAKISVENYSSFFYKPEHLKHRQLIVCDEASELENIIVSRFSCSIEIGRLNTYGFKLPYTVDRKRFFNNLCTLQARLEDRYVELLRMIDKRGDTVSDYIKKEYKFISDLKGDLVLVIDTWSQSEYIINKKYIRNKQYIQLIPKKVDTLAQHIFKYADNVILMSATFVDYRSVMRNLGIVESDYKYIDLPSHFDPKKSPILFGSFQLNKKNLEQSFPKVVDCVKEILEEHKDEKGLIHTQSNVITKMLKDKINDDRILYRIRGNKDNVDILAEHLQTDKPTVLASPSMSFGVDLKGAAARFCIILKCPWPDLGDVRIKEMSKSNKKWYTNKMFTTFIQQCGRCTRDENDTSVTYVLDAVGIRNLIPSYRNLLPMYFTDRFI